MTFNLADLMLDPRRLDDLPADVLPVVLRQVALVQTQLDLLRSAVLSRMAGTATAARGKQAPADDLLDDVSEVAGIVRRSVSWVRKHGHTLPGFHQPGGKGHKVGWSRGALLTWRSGAA